MKRNKTYKFEEPSPDSTNLDLYLRICSKVVVVNENSYHVFNFSIKRNNKEQLVRWENDQLRIATRYSLEKKGTKEGESVLFDFNVPIGTTWPVDIDNAIFVTTSVFKFSKTFKSECLDEQVYVFEVTELIKASHIPYFTRFYVTKGYGIIGVELERERYPDDRLIRFYRMNPLLKKLDCRFPVP